MGRLLNAVLAAPVTSTVRGVSTEVAVGNEDDIRVASVANLDNLQLVSRSRFVRRVGNVRVSTLSQLCSALATATSCG